jgi:hypothetical protein
MGENRTQSNNAELLKMRECEMVCPIRWRESYVCEAGKSMKVRGKNIAG